MTKQVLKKIAIEEFNAAKAHVLLSLHYAHNDLKDYIIEYDEDEDDVNAAMIKHDMINVVNDTIKAISREFTKQTKK